MEDRALSEVICVSVEARQAYVDMVEIMMQTGEKVNKERYNEAKQITLSQLLLLTYFPMVFHSFMSLVVVSTYFLSFVLVISNADKIG